MTVVEGVIDNETVPLEVIVADMEAVTETVDERVRFALNVDPLDIETITDAENCADTVVSALIIEEPEIVAVLDAQLETLIVLNAEIEEIGERETDGDELVERVKILRVAVIVNSAVAEDVAEDDAPPPPPPPPPLEGDVEGEEEIDKVLENESCSDFEESVL